MLLRFEPLTERTYLGTVGLEWLGSLEDGANELEKPSEKHELDALTHDFFQDPAVGCPGKFIHHLDVLVPHTVQVLGLLALQLPDAATRDVAII